MRWLFPLSLTLLFSSLPAFCEEKQGKVDFLEEVRPILAGNCFPCHGPDKAKRKAKKEKEEAGVLRKQEPHLGCGEIATQ